MKSITQMHNLSAIKGLHSVRLRSIPKRQRSSYLGLYVLDREMASLEKERFALDKRRNNVKKRLDSLTTRMEQLQKEIKEEQEPKPYKGVSPRKPLKIMSIHY